MWPSMRGKHAQTLTAVGFSKTIVLSISSCMWLRARSCACVPLCVCVYTRMMTWVVFLPSFFYNYLFLLYWPESSLRREAVTAMAVITSTLFEIQQLFYEKWTEHMSVHYYRPVYRFGKAFITYKTRQWQWLLPGGDYFGASMFKGTVRLNCVLPFKQDSYICSDL
jgi:hypothetical protein